MEGRQITNLRIGVRVPARLQKWRIGNREGCHYFAPVGKLAKPPHFLCGHCGFESRREYTSLGVSALLYKLQWGGCPDLASFYHNKSDLLHIIARYLGVYMGLV